MRDRTLHPVLLAELPVTAFSEAVTYLGDVLRECQLLVVDADQGADVDPAMEALARALVPDLEELREIFRAATITSGRDGVRVEAEMRVSDAALLAHLQMQLVQARFLGRGGLLLVASDPEVTQFLAWVWDESADQLHGRRPRPYRVR